MAKKTYSINFNGATEGELQLSDLNFVFSIPWNADAATFESMLNSGHIHAGWQVTGTGPFDVMQAEEIANYNLTITGDTFDSTPSISVSQEWLPSVNLSVDDNAISEPIGESIVAFSLFAAHSASITVPFTFGGTAEISTDYSASTTSPVTIASGETIATMSISVVDNHAFESDETVTVTIGSITGGEAGTSSIVTITISDDDTQGPTMVIKAPTGLTLTAKIFARGSDTLIETVTLAERTNAKTIYEGDVTESESGWYHAVIYSGATPLGSVDVFLTTDPTEHYTGDYCPIEDPSGLLSSVTVADGSITAAKIGADAITAAKVASDVGSEIASAVRTNLATELGRIDVASSTLATSTQAVALLATAAAILDDTGTSGVVVAAGSKTGYSLSATGLNAIPITDPGAIGNYTNWPTLLVGLFQLQISHKTVKSTSAQTITSYAADGSTPNFAMGFTSSGGIDTKGAAT